MTETRTIQEFYAVHEGGTKFYRIFAARRGNQARVVFNFGKVGARGSTETHEITHADPGAMAMKKLREKEKRGYTFTRGFTREVDDTNGSLPGEPMRDTLAKLRLISPVVVNWLMVASELDDPIFDTPAPTEPTVDKRLEDPLWGVW